MNAPLEKPVVAKKGSFPVDVEKGKAYLWCVCGRSKTQPFCDDSHKGTSFSPLSYTAEDTRTIFFCGCKATKKQPICDGSHSRL